MTQLPDFVTNSLGMTLALVPAGPSFHMGSQYGLPDERPVHRVRITQPFRMATTPVTNAQFEQFDPQHHQWRGKANLSRHDDEAVIFVSWHDAEAFCRWLSAREGVAYRLPTEAEWEYACRAGTGTQYFTGDQLPDAYHRSQKFSWLPAAVDLTVGTTPANVWGLHDMAGLVEQWCSDWYAPYGFEPQDDPIGPAEGHARVTRGGSHNTDVRFLRSAARMAALPEDRSWAIGFRVVQAEPSPGQTQQIHRSPRLWQCRVRANPPADLWRSTCDAAVFRRPTPFVIPPSDRGEPFYPHNHCPSITWCDNGDLLAVWFSTIHESGREMVILGSRRRAGEDAWEPASEFFDIASRNLTGTSLFNTGHGVLHHYNAVGVTEGWANLAMMLRTSDDHGVTWSHPRLIQPEHRLGHQVISGTSRMPDGTIIQPCDAVWGGEGGTVIHLSGDEGRTWCCPAAEAEQVTFEAGQSGRRIAGIHAGVVALRDGRLLALGRGNNIDGHMPMSVSADQGRTWRYLASDFAPISGGQRLVLMRLAEGPILLVSFTDDASRLAHPRKIDRPAELPQGMVIPDAAGQDVRVFGMFAALSYDDGQSWPVKKLVAPHEGSETFDGGGWTGTFVLSPTTAESRGYLAATQTPDGLIHLLSSRLHYCFNLRWIQTPCPHQR